MASLGGESVIAPYSSMILCPTLASMGLWCTLSVTPPPKKVPKYWRSIRCHPDSSDNHNYTPGRKREMERAHEIYSGRHQGILWPMKIATSQGKDPDSDCRLWSSILSAWERQLRSKWPETRSVTQGDPGALALSNPCEFLPLPLCSAPVAEFQWQVHLCAWGFLHTLEIPLPSHRRAWEGLIINHPPKQSELPCEKPSAICIRLGWFCFCLPHLPHPPLQPWIPVSHSGSWQENISSTGCFPFPVSPAYPLLGIPSYSQTHFAQGPFPMRPR